MREDVGIVLNEREPLKAKLAEELAERLNRQDITVSRIAIDAKIEDTVLRRKPRILIVDYLLGDHSTGLDVLRRLKEIDQATRPKTIFLTDEPSVPVAVEALREGAVNFIECDHPQAVSRTLLEVKRLLETKPARPSKVTKSNHTLDDLISHSPVMRETLAHIKRAATTKTPALVLLGPKGSGRLTLARCYAQGRGESFAAELDLATWPGSLTDLLRRERGGGFALGDNCGYLFITDDSEDTELIDFLTEHKRKFGSNGSWICIITRDQNSARAAKKLFDAEVITIKPLAEHKSDIAPLTQSFIRAAHEFSGHRPKLPDSATLSALAEMEWPGDISELRSVITAASIDHSLSQGELIEAVKMHKLAWEEEQNEQHSRRVTALSAATCLAQNHGNFRVTAAKLGVTITTLRELLSKANVTCKGAAGSNGKRSDAHGQTERDGSTARKEL